MIVRSVTPTRIVQMATVVTATIVVLARHDFVFKLQSYDAPCTVCLMARVVTSARCAGLFVSLVVGVLLVPAADQRHAGFVHHVLTLPHDAHRHCKYTSHVSTCRCS